MTPAAYIVHRVGGRVRLRIPDKRRDTAWLRATAAALEQLPGVTRVEASPATGSLLVYLDEDTSLEALLPLAQSRFRLIPGWGPQRPALEPIVVWTTLLNQRLQHYSRGSADLRSLLFALFMFLAVMQVMRGRVMVPAISLLWYAMELALPPVGRRGDGYPTSADLEPQNFPSPRP